MVGIEHLTEDEEDSTLETDSSLSLLNPPDEYDSDISISDLEEVAADFEDKNE